jgi:hypothetical protein
MRRSYGFSASTVARLVSASRAAEKRKENASLIAENADLSKERAPEYYLTSVNFSDATRATKIEIVKRTYYRKIVRYVTRNYVKYPIYSDWVYREKRITKSIVLNNETLEGLPDNEDPLIAAFAIEILTKIGKEEIYPSWLQTALINVEYKEKAEEWANLERATKKETDDASAQCKTNLAKIQKDFLKNEKKLQRQNKRLQKIEAQEEKMTEPIPLWLGLCTLGIIYLFRGKTARKFLNKKHDKTKEKIDLLKSKKAYFLKDKKGVEEAQAALIEKYQKFLSEAAETKKKNDKQQAEDLSDVEELPTTPDEDESFHPLSSFAGMTKQKIVGCYVIRNRYNHKCYVGQSKDVLRRLGQHFNGTVPE